MRHFLRSKSSAYLLATLPVLFIASEALARAGGGGHGSSSSGIVTLILLPFVIAYRLYVNWRINKRQKEVHNALAVMGRHESQWDEPKLLEIARNKFILLQAAWGQMNMEVIQKNLDPILYQLWSSQLFAYKASGIQNVMDGLSINKMRIVDAKNFADDQKDEFTVCFDAKANDRIIQKGKVVSNDSSAFREFWTFRWHDNEWILHSVTEAGGWNLFMNSQIVFEKISKKKAS